MKRMKTFRLSFTLLLLAVAVAVNAAPITMQEARNTALDFLTSTKELRRAKGMSVQQPVLRLANAFARQGRILFS